VRSFDHREWRLRLRIIRLGFGARNGGREFIGIAGRGFGDGHR
jgi:hypothetical protein